MPRSIQECIRLTTEAVLIEKKKVAVAFIGDKLRVRATGRGKEDKRSPGREILLTIGRPNYREREFLKLCKKGNTKPKALWFPSGR